MKKLILFFTLIVPISVFSQSNPNDAPIVKRIHSEIINSFVFETSNISFGLVNPSFFGNKSIDKVTVDLYDSTGNFLNLFNYTFSYDRLCRINNIDKKVPLSNTLNQNWFVNWQNNQTGITLPEYIVGEDSTRFLYKYDVNEDITERTRQDFTSSGMWVGDRDYGAQYSNFDLCGNYLYSTPNNPSKPPFTLSMNYSSGTCLPTSKIYSVPDVFGTRTYKETWVYSPTYNLERHKYESTSTSAGSGFSCTINEFSYKNNKIDTVWKINCQNLSKATDYSLTWNQDGTISKIKRFNSYYSQVGNIRVKYTIISFTYNGCIINSMNENIKNMFKLYPNPVNEKLIIEIGDLNIQGFSLSISNLTGSIVLPPIPIPNDRTIDLSNLSKGIYFLRIMNEDGFFTKKFVKL